MTCSPVLTTWPPGLLLVITDCSGHMPTVNSRYLDLTIFSIYLLTSGVKLHIHLLNVVVRFIVFLNSANLICPGMAISKYSRESLGLRVNESQLYMFWVNTDILDHLREDLCNSIMPNTVNMYLSYL